MKAGGKGPPGKRERELGCPVNRPVCYHFDTHLRDKDGEEHVSGDDEHRRDAASCDYLCGAGVLVCPVYVKGAKGRGVDMPDRRGGAEWYDMRGGGWCDGGDVTWVDVGLKDLTATFVLGGTAVCRTGKEGGGVVVDSYVGASGVADGEGHYEGIGWVQFSRKGSDDFVVKAEKECNVQVREWVRGVEGFKTLNVRATPF